MNKNSEKLSRSCSSSEDLVAYLYDEMGAAEQSVLETHLAGCDLCTAEFADLSFSRLGVYEWHRDDFAPLAAPHFVIPYEPARTTWIEAVRTFFAAPSRWATAAGAFAVVAIAASVWYFIPGSPEIARSGQPEASPVRSAVQTADARPAVAVEPQPAEQVTGQKTKGPLADGSELRRDSVKITANQPSKKRPVQKPVRSERPAVPAEQAKRPVRVPRLNDFEDEEDTTLRLGDLLAEVDTTDR